MEHFSAAPLWALIQVIVIDLVMAADNAIALGLSAHGLPRALRRKAIAIGLAVAVLFRIGFAMVAVSLLEIAGLAVAGGLLLLWVAWKLRKELHAQHKSRTEALVSKQAVAYQPPQKTLAQAILQITIADLSMSLDNVLAVAGAAVDHPRILVTGLLLSILLMGLAANWVASKLEKHRWIGMVGVLIVVYVAIKMIYQGISAF